MLFNSNGSLSWSPSATVSTTGSTITFGASGTGGIDIPQTLATVIVSNGNANLRQALAAGSVEIAPTWNLRGDGFSLTADRVTVRGFLVGSNGTVFAGSLFNSGVVSQQTSTVSLLAGDNVVSNVPAFYNLVKYIAGTARLVSNTVVEGTLEFQAGANLDGTGSSLVLSNAGVVGGNAQRVTVSGDVLRVDGVADGVSGRANYQRQGRR